MGVLKMDFHVPLRIIPSDVESISTMLEKFLTKTKVETNLTNLNTNPIKITKCPHQKMWYYAFYVQFQLAVPKYLNYKYHT